MPFGAVSSRSSTFFLECYSNFPQDVSLDFELDWKEIEILGIEIAVVLQFKEIQQSKSFKQNGKTR